MDLDTALLAAAGAIVSGMSAAIVALWQKNNALHDQNRDDKNKAANLIFALLQARREDRGEPAPPTLSEWNEEPTTQVTERKFVEAQAHARAELNGETERLLKAYLTNSTLPPSG